MKFKVEDVIRLNTDLTYGDQMFAAGTLGRIGAVVESWGGYLVILGHDSTSRFVSEGRIDLVAKATSLVSPTSARSKSFPVDTRVKLLQDRDFGDVVLPKGSLGTVRAHLPTFDSYIVDFDDDATDRIVASPALGPAKSA